MGFEYAKAGISKSSAQVYNLFLLRRHLVAKTHSWDTFHLRWRQLQFLQFFVEHFSRHLYLVQLQHFTKNVHMLHQVFLRPFQHILCSMESKHAVAIWYRWEAKTYGWSGSIFALCHLLLRISSVSYRLEHHLHVLLFIWARRERLLCRHWSHTSADALSRCASGQTCLWPSATDGHLVQALQKHLDIFDCVNVILEVKLFHEYAPS